MAVWLSVTKIARTSRSFYSVTKQLVLFLQLAVGFVLRERPVVALASVAAAVVESPSPAQPHSLSSTSLPAAISDEAMLVLQ